MSNLLSVSAKVFRQGKVKDRLAISILLWTSVVYFTNTAFAQPSQEYFCGPDYPEESQSIDTIIPAIYKSVSGFSGSEKNWGLLRKLHSPTATITPVFHHEGTHTAKTYSLDEFIELNKIIFKDKNFFENEVNSKIFSYGHTATVLSHYESRDSLIGVPYSQGVNSFQLLNDGRRWCVISVTWDSDKGGHQITTDILK